jgi:hypothetical protein
VSQLTTRTVTMSNGIGENQLAAGETRRSDIKTDRYWVSVATEEPVSHDLKQLVREDLIKAWQFRREEAHRDDIKTYWGSTDGSRLVLEDVVGNFDTMTACQLSNKLTALYCLQSAHSNHGRLIPDKITRACVYDEWRRYQDSASNIEYGHYFAHLVRIAPRGPRTVQDIIRAHLSLCAQTSSLIEQANQQVNSTAFGVGLRPYSLLPLYRSMVVILDRLDGRNAPLVEDSDGKYSMSMFARLQTVLIACTGVEEGLSEAISFEGLESWPLEEADVIARGANVVRVSLAAAVQFICGLEAREEAAFPKPDGPFPLDQRLCPYIEHRPCFSPEVWADAIMAEAEKQGYDNIYEAWQSIRRVKADLVGEGFCELEHMPLENHWKP